MANASSDSQQAKGQPYDNTFKLLMEGQEEQVLHEILPEAQYIETLNIEQPEGPLRVDRVYKMRYKGEEHILDLEFETASDHKFIYRLLEYHAYFLRKYELPVISLVIYPFPTTVVESPLKEMSGQETISNFPFSSLASLEVERRDVCAEAYHLYVFPSASYAWSQLTSVNSGSQ